MKTTMTNAPLANRLSSLRLNAWNLWTKPHNAMMILLASAVLLQSKAWKIRSA